MKDNSKKKGLANSIVGYVKELDSFESSKDSYWVPFYVYGMVLYEITWWNHVYVHSIAMYLSNNRKKRAIIAFNGVSMRYDLVKGENYNISIEAIASKVKDTIGCTIEEMPEEMFLVENVTSQEAGIIRPYKPSSVKEHDVMVNLEGVKHFSIKT